MEQLQDTTVLAHALLPGLILILECDGAQVYLNLKNPTLIETLEQ